MLSFNECPMSDDTSKYHKNIWDLQYKRYMSCSVILAAQLEPVLLYCLVGQMYLHWRPVCHLCSLL